MANYEVLGLVGALSQINYKEYIQTGGLLAGLSNAISATAQILKEAPEPMNRLGTSIPKVITAPIVMNTYGLDVSSDYAKDWAEANPQTLRDQVFAMVGKLVEAVNQ